MTYSVSIGGLWTMASWNCVCVHHVASSLWVHAWLDWTHNYLHLSCAECRRGHWSCSGESCVCCVVIRRLPGPVTNEALLSEMERRRHFYFTALVWAQSTDPGDTSSSSVGLIQQRVFMVRLCPVGRHLFLQLLCKDWLDHNMSKILVSMATRSFLCQAVLSFYPALRLEILDWTCH